MKREPTPEEIEVIKDHAAWGVGRLMHARINGADFSNRGVCRQFEIEVAQKLRWFFDQRGLEPPQWVYDDPPDRS